MNSEKPGSGSFVRVIDGPVRVDGGVVRLIETSDGSGRVESWDGRAWVPGGATVKGVLKGTPCADPEQALKECNEAFGALQKRYFTPPRSAKAIGQTFGFAAGLIMNPELRPFWIVLALAGLWLLSWMLS